MASLRREDDGVCWVPAPLGARLIMAGIVLILASAIAALATRCHWANREAPPFHGPARIACVGDSITFGFGLGNRVEECWTYLLPGLLDDGSTVGNYGVSGTCALADGYAPWAATPQAQEFWGAEEDIVILMLGTNDVFDQSWSEEAYERDILALVEKIRSKHEKPQVIIMIPPTLFGSPGHDALLVDEVSPALERVARQTGSGLLDLHALTRDRPEWFLDGVHPNEQGNEAIAAYIAESMR